MRVYVVKACHVNLLESQDTRWGSLPEAHTEVGESLPRLRLSLWLERECPLCSWGSSCVRF